MNNIIKTCDPTIRSSKFTLNIRINKELETLFQIEFLLLFIDQIPKLLFIEQKEKHTSIEQERA